MDKPKPRSRLPLLLMMALMPALCPAAENEPRRIEMARRPPTHDPVMIKEGDTYHLFCTGGMVSVYTSTNMVEWTRSGQVFDKLPEWVAKELPQTREAWAPDIAYFNGLYHLYYSLSSFGVNESAIGLAVNKTLDRNNPDYKWEDRGMVIRSRSGETDFNAIDPNLVIVDEKNLWLSWGSFWGGIMIRKIDPETGKASRDDASVYAIASRPRNYDHQTPPTEGAIEAPFIVRHDDYWYLFASYDFCCRGVDSTYNVRVGRSKEITGPYLDRDGTPMREGGGTMVIEATTPNWKGPGHEAVFREGGQDYLLFHAYDGVRGRPSLHISTMEWVDGWPRVAPLP